MNKHDKHDFAILILYFVCTIGGAVFFLWASGALGSEVEECQRIAPKYKAKTEVMLWDGTRVDLLNDEYAIEVDWSHKWAEGIGQALYYADVSGLKPGVILLVKDKEKERQYIYRLQTVCVKRGIKFWLEDVE